MLSNKGITINITLGQVISVLLIGLIGIGIGYFIPHEQTCDLDSAYLAGTYDVANAGLRNGSVNVCDLNDNCVTLYEEQYLVKQQELNSSNEVI